MNHSPEKKFSFYAIIADITRSKLDEKSKRNIGRLLNVVIGIAALSIVLFGIDVYGHTRANPWPLGTIGDFFGGVLNPILTFFTVAGLAVTIIFQQAGFSATRKQSFETTFFNMLDLHNKIVQDLRFDPAIIPENPNLAKMIHTVNYGNQHSPIPVKTPEPVVGRQVFSEIVKRITAGAHPGTDEVALYRKLQEEHNYVLGHYFRNLYQLLKLIESFASELEDPKAYSNILRAQLSTYELILLFYNCLPKMVDNGAFERLVVTYCVLEHLPLEFAERMGKSANAETEVTVTLKGQNPENKLILTLSGKHLPQQYIYISGYFSQNGAGEATSGAYGSNPEVAKFLEKMYNPMGINPRF